MLGNRGARISASLAFLLNAGLAGCGPRQAGHSGEAPLVSVVISRASGPVEIQSTDPQPLRLESARSAPVALENTQVLSVRAPGDGSLRLEVTGGPSGWSSVVAPPLRIQGRHSVRVDGTRYPHEVRLEVDELGALRVINVTDLETYLRGVVPNEIGFMEYDVRGAIEAQAVASRTYALWRTRQPGGGALQSTVMDQVYGGIDSWHPISDESIRATRGTVLLAREGLAWTLFHSTCSGRTDAVELMWPKQGPRSYLEGGDDLDPLGRPWCTGSKYFDWEERWPADELESVLRVSLAEEFPGFDVPVGPPGSIGVEIFATSETGRVAEAGLSAWGRTFFLRGERIRWVLRRPGGDSILRSSRITEISEGDTLRIAGQGWGHGLGMCQVGALERARRGADWRSILEAYYPGTRPEERY